MNRRRIDLPRTNPLALNTCEFFNVSSDNQFVDVGLRGETGERLLVPRYVSPGVDMSRLPRFMRVQPIRPGTIIHMNFPSTSFYSERNMVYADGQPVQGSYIVNNDSVQPNP